MKQEEKELIKKIAYNKGISEDRIVVCEAKASKKTPNEKIFYITKKQKEMSELILFFSNTDALEFYKYNPRNAYELPSGTFMGNTKFIRHFYTVSNQDILFAQSQLKNDKQPNGVEASRADVIKIIQKLQQEINENNLIINSLKNTYGI